MSVQPRVGRARVFAMAMMLGVVGCGGTSETADQAAPAQQSVEKSATPGSEAPPSSQALSAEQSKLVERAVTLAKAIQAAPDRAVGILAEQGITPEQWSTMLEDIARDPALAAAYETGMR